MTPPPPRCPPLDPSTSTWQWTQSALSSLQWRRCALGSECLWVPRQKEFHQMFLSGLLTLSSPVSTSTLCLSATNAWRRLRFEVPELAVNSAFEEDSKAYMRYREPTDADVSQWIERTTSFERSKGRWGFQHLRDKILERKEGCDTDQALLLLHAQVADAADGRVERLDFILNVDHQITDGIGIRILLGRYLALLAKYLSQPPGDQEDIKWQDSVKNLTSPWISIMNEEQVISGPGYERSVMWNKELLLRDMPRNPGLPLLRTPQTKEQKTHFITLSEAQSNLLVQTIKHVVRPEANITHLVHAAMVLALLRSIPPPPSSQTLHSPCWLNGRRYLKVFAGQPNPTKSYIPICQSFAPVVFSHLQDLILPLSASKDDIKRTVVKACGVATAEYEKIRRRGSMLPECVSVMEELGRNASLEQRLQERIKTETLVTESPPWQIQPPGADLGVPPATDELELESEPTGSSIRSPTADPFFLSDGLTEQYIDHEYFDFPISPSRERVFEVDDIKFAANAEKNLIVRMSSWRGRTTILGEWRACDYDSDMIFRFLEDVVAIMLSIVEP